MGFAPTWLRQVSPPSMLHKTTLTTVDKLNAAAGDDIGDDDDDDDDDELRDDEW